ncbi:hypothetical protein [Erythrobacter longus]|uniref:hypothetical protein n=1 Tax=Erythrobacter longus TaxID=1044 RepID=UPI00068E4866|nr:hypothetical protein [Erythrobacter longus]
MKAVYFQTAGALALTLVIAACVGGPDLPPPIIAPSSAPVARPAPPPAPIVREPVFENYLDAPQTPGTWRYANDAGETLALYGVGDAYRFIIRCDKSSRQIGLGRVGEEALSPPRVMEISTETTKRSLTLEQVTDTGRLVAAYLSPSDPLLDAMAITKGRFAVGVEGERTLYLPA